MFKFELGELLTVTKTGEKGEVKGRAEYIEEANKYWVDCESNSDLSANFRFKEEDLQAL